MTSVLFRNGALLDPLQPELIPGHEVLVEEGRIKEVSDRPIKTTGARVIDLKGKTLMSSRSNSICHAWQPCPTCSSRCAPCR
jgi:dihydroorotase-like cyclic amidohydrolase